MTDSLLLKISEPLTDKQNNKNHCLATTSSEVWDFRIDCYRYQICKQWLQARNGFPLNKEDIQRYQRILMILKELAKLMEEIKIITQSNQLKKVKVFEKVQNIVVEKLGIDPEKVTPIANFTRDLGADSLDILELIVALEETFNIEISNQATTKFETVQHTIDYISQQLEIDLELAN
ncbi:acyl carrier protein [Nostoc sp. MG11]|uniref:acyl carrier protein n=1 Tax=Nostoc sp. MG11 TaxID=2721166 RepID=UPI0029FEFFBD|nr:acyl carrier protein [Nostoc sp. MG11]